MSTSSQKYEIRLSVENGKAVVAEMKQVGEAGNKAFKDITDGANILDRELGRLQSSISGRLAAVLGPAALAAGLRASISHFAELEGAAKRAGWAIQGLQEMQYMAVQFGESADVMSEALGEFNKRVAEAQSGQGKLLKEFERYDVALKDSNGRLRDSSEILRDYADRVKGAATEQEKIRLSIAAFGEGAGKQLVDVLAAGSEGMDEFAEKARSTGQILDESMVKRAKELDDQLKAIVYTADVLWKSSFIKVLDEAIELFEKLAEVAERAGNVSALFWSSYKSQTGAGNIMRSWGREVDALDARKRNGELAAGADELLAGLNAKKPNGSPAWRSGTLSDLLRVETPAALPESEDEKDGRLKEEEAARKKMQSVIDLLRFRNEQMRRGNDEQELYNQLRAAGTTLDTAAGQQIKILVDEYQAYQDEIRRTKESTEALQKATDGFFERLIDGFADGKISAAEMQQAVLQLFKQILLAKDSVTGQSLFPNIMGQVASGMGSFISGIFGFENGGIMTSRGAVPLRMYEAGGIARGPQVAIYGEGKQAEAYVPLPDGRTIPVTMTGAGTVMQVQIIDQAGVDVQPQMSGNGKSMKILLKKQVSGMLRSGELDAPLRDRTGVNRTLRET